MGGGGGGGSASYSFFSFSFLLTQFSALVTNEYLLLFQMGGVAFFAVQLADVD